MEAQSARRRAAAGMDGGATYGRSPKRRAACTIPQLSGRSGARLGECRPPRPRDHLPAGRGGRQRPDGARHPRCHPPITSATAMRVTAIHGETERNRLDGSARCAEKRRRRARSRQLRGLIRPVPAARAAKDAGWGENACPVRRFRQTSRQTQRYLGNVGQMTTRPRVSTF